jgi:[NiFe] hydrogenase assembly HybE family chaperone
MVMPNNSWFCRILTARESQMTPDNTVLISRVNALAFLYQKIATTRMQGIPLLNLALHVETIGFEQTDRIADNDLPERNMAQAAATGVLITPWFMNLVWLPLQRVDYKARVGSKFPRYVGSECFEFIGAHESEIGGYESCSLFSPVFAFDDHATAVATAWSVLNTLRQPVSPLPASETPQAPARRAFLFGRGLDTAPTTSLAKRRQFVSDHG